MHFHRKITEFEQPELNPFTAQVLEEIDKNIDNSQYQLMDLCHQMHLSRTQLYRRLKEYTGYTFSYLLHERRIRKAIYLLRHSTLNISEIGLELGINDPSYFVKVFRKEIGLTPSAFRRNCRRPLLSPQIA